MRGHTASLSEDLLIFPVSLGQDIEITDLKYVKRCKLIIVHQSVCKAINLYLAWRCFMRDKTTGLFSVYTVYYSDQVDGLQFLPFSRLNSYSYYF